MAKTMQQRGERTATLITELAKLAVLAWEGVADDKGKAAPVTPRGRRRLDGARGLWPTPSSVSILPALYALDAEKNV